MVVCQEFQLLTFIHKFLNYKLKYGKISMSYKNQQNWKEIQKFLPTESQLTNET